MKVDRIHAVHVEDSIDNRRVVRSRDDRMSKDLLWIGGVVLVLIALFVAYGWPRAALRDTGSSAGKLQREQEKLREENRELRLEKAALQDLARIQAIATGSLGLQSPPPASVVVVERPQNLPKDSRVAVKTEPGGTTQ
ncbi:MAG: cell division protein FtsL [Vicinamibacteria bacterium]|jgi:cell division protein FtsL|nr:cell division protein FtsL [Vicinamibacteria bacterium]MBP9945573.1 cell division protein FtsL [Vicinamibacteria bacterium]